MIELDRIQSACTEVAKCFFALQKVYGQNLTDERMADVIDSVAKNRNLPSAQIRFGLMGAGIAAFYQVAMAREVGMDV